jgi:BirA family transcriptional regulator, biotin operon repressor / biotin---[acetyl-CoA-carboxylase] ligase
MSAEPLDPAVLSAASPWGLPVRVVNEITSTNDELLRRGEEGAPSGTLLFAESQTAGRGRFRRPWSSAPGLGLWFSLLLRMGINDASVPALSAFAAVALISALRSLGATDAGIKEPNDVLIGGLKVAGILVETRVGSNPFAVVGIGLNVNHTPEDFPPELRERATSIAIATGTRHNLTEAALPLLSELGYCGILMRERPEELLKRWRSLLLPASAVRYWDK